MDNESPATILIVDDARLYRELLRLQLARHGHSFLTATNGREAVEVFTAHPEIDLILLDLMMPEMNGFDFLRWRSRHPEAQMVPVIVNSSLDDFDSIAKALEMGSYDYFAKPLAQQDLDHILPVKIRNAVNAKRLMEKTSRQNELLRRELTMAARYQQFLLPKATDLPGIKVAALFQPCTGVGGDYFDFFELSSGAIGFVVADVSGHGVASAMTASIVKALLPGYLEAKGSPAEALTALNDDLVHLTQEDSFVTCFAGLYQPDQPRFTWSSAGHPPPLLLEPGRRPVRLTMESLFLGAFDSGHEVVAYADQSFPVSHGLRLALYTDGLTEVADPQGNPYGTERLEKLLEDNRDRGVTQVKHRLAQDLNRFADGVFPDDVAFILVEF